MSEGRRRREALQPRSAEDLLCEHLDLGLRRELHPLQVSAAGKGPAPYRHDALRDLQLLQRRVLEAVVSDDLEELRQLHASELAAAEHRRPQAPQRGRQRDARQATVGKYFGLSQYFQSFVQHRLDQLSTASESTGPNVTEGLWGDEANKSRAAERTAVYLLETAGVSEHNVIQ